MSFHVTSSLAENNYNQFGFNRYGIKPTILNMYF